MWDTCILLSGQGTDQIIWSFLRNVDLFLLVPKRDHTNPEAEKSFVTAFSKNSTRAKMTGSCAKPGSAEVNK